MTSGLRLSSCPSFGAKGEQFLWPKNARPRSKHSRTPVEVSPVVAVIPDSVRVVVEILDRSPVAVAIPAATRDRSRVVVATRDRSPVAADNLFPATGRELSRTKVRLFF